MKMEKYAKTRLLDRKVIRLGSMDGKFKTTLTLTRYEITRVRHSSKSLAFETRARRWTYENRPAPEKYAHLQGWKEISFGLDPDKIILEVYREAAV